MMDRRRFLEALIASGLAATIDPERLLWTPKAMITVPRNYRRISGRIVGFTATTVPASGYGWFLVFNPGQDRLYVHDPHE